MRKIKEEELVNIKGGTDISGSIVSAFTEIIRVLFDAGHSVGSAIRRYSEGELCPLD